MSWFLHIAALILLLQGWILAVMWRKGYGCSVLILLAITIVGVFRTVPVLISYQAVKVINSFNY